MDDLRDIADAPTIRAAIYENTLNTAASFKPLTAGKHTLSLENPRYIDEARDSIKDNKHAILTGGTRFRRLQGDWVLRDTTSQEELSRKRSIIARVPHMTDDGVFIINGSLYPLAHQPRLRPGVYARQKSNGEIESHINIMPGQGVSHRIGLDPESGLLHIGLSQAKIPFYTMMRAMGTSEAELSKHFSPEIHNANLKKMNAAALTKLYQKLRPKNELPGQSRSPQEVIRTAFEGMRVDPEVTQATLGKPYDHLSSDMYLDAAKKLFAINRGETDPDDRDHVAYQLLMGPEDLISQRFGADLTQARRAFWRAIPKRDLKGFPSGVFSKGLFGAITETGLGSATESINPLMVYDQRLRATRLGEGGIPSAEAIPEESRSVQPSHLGVIDPLATPESDKVGVDVRLATGVKKGRDGKVYIPVRDAITREIVYKSANELRGQGIAFSGELSKSDSYVAGVLGNRTGMIPRQNVTYELPYPDSGYTPMVQLIPFKGSMQPKRASMAQRMLTQAFPIANAEAPFVQSGTHDRDDDSYESRFGVEFGAKKAKVGGSVIKVDADSITILGDDGKEHVTELYNYFPYNRKTYIHNTAQVNVGDRVEPGKLIASSNYTDKQGTTAVGLNARVAYIPYKGFNFDDGIVISEEFAKRSAAQRMYQHELKAEDTTKQRKLDFISIFPAAYTRKTLETLDDGGVVKPGTIVKQGDPLILAARLNPADRQSLLKGGKRSFTDATQIWDHEHDGEVVDVVRTDNGTLVTVKTQTPLAIGDKLSGRYGDKGVIAEVVPTERMLRDAKGRPFEVVLNPLGLNPRTNPGQAFEALLGKIVAERGVPPYKVKDFVESTSAVDWVQSELDKHGLSDVETITDPDDGDREIPGIFTGNRFIMSMHHTADSKAQGRGIGGYAADGMPSKGGKTGAKRFSLMDFDAAIAHGATGVIQDASLYRGQAHPEFWSMMMRGHQIPTPDVPLVNRKFIDNLRGSGINVVQKGREFQLMALTNRDIETLAAGREIQSAGLADWNNMQPISGGLFDEALTGGHNGNRWSRIKLPEPMPNPAMELPIRKLLGLSEKEYRGVLSGSSALSTGSGPAAISKALAAIDLDAEITRNRQLIQTQRGAKRDDAVRRLGYLKRAKSVDIHPKDWVVDSVPVIPPIFRPISVMSDSKLPMIADPNVLYAEVIHAKEAFNGLKGKVNDLSAERLAIYDSFKGVTGLGQPTQQVNREREVKGLLNLVFGSSPKYGMVQQKLLGSSVDLVGRATIVPDPKLDMDEVGIPEDSAWSIYKPFIVRALRRRGVNMMQAAKMLEDRHPEARRELLQAMDSRPVIANRAPVLHKYGVMAFWPKLVKDNTLHVAPVVTPGFNADFDGDAMQFHVPLADDAVRDAVNKMLPSRNLISANTFRPHQLPQKEFALGLYAASLPAKGEDRPVFYANRRLAISDYLNAGKLHPNQAIRVIKNG